jgi:hypothetical protein
MARQIEEEDHDPVIVDEHNLDKEWQAQAWFMKRACLRSAAAKRRLLDARTRLKVWQAETKLRIRSRPEQYGIVKLNNDVVDETMLTQPEYLRQEQDIAKLTEAWDVAEAEVTALSHKKAALENSVVLWGRDYGSEPRIPSEDNERARRKMKDKVQSGRGLYPQEGMKPRDKYED